MGPRRPTMGTKTLQGTLRALLLTRGGANIAPIPVRRKSQMGSLANLLLLFTVFLGRVGGQVALPDGKNRTNSKFLKYEESTGVHTKFP